jgi:hypothetical protein
MAKRLPIESDRGLPIFRFGPSNSIEDTNEEVVIGAVPVDTDLRWIRPFRRDSEPQDLQLQWGWITRRDDSFGLLIVLAVTTIAAIHLLVHGTLVGQDAATQFYPWYGYLGEQIRALEIPGWNPFQFAGTPFAADPQSGWTYLPAMLLFGLLPLPLAVPAFLWLHLALAGIGTYLLARALGMPALAAVVAATAYQLTGPVYGRSVCCPAAMEVAVWAPWALAGAELAIRSGSPRSRLCGWAIAGFAVSQATAAWLGQGSYYLLLAMYGFIAYRTLVAPAEKLTIRSRVMAAAMHSVAISLIGFGLGAIGILPRLDYVARSNLAGGEYAGASSWAARISGVTTDSVFDRLLVPTLYYPGTATLALALIGLTLARGKHAAPYFGFLGITATLLASPKITPIHRLLFAVLPRFEELHQHWPERVSLVAYIAPAMLAGASVAVLLDPAKRALWRTPVVIIPVVIALVLWTNGAGVTQETFLAAGAAVALSLVLLFAPTPPLRRAISLLLVVVIAADLLMASRMTASQAPYGGFHRVDISDYYASNGAGALLEDRAGTAPFRTFGYDPSLQAIQDGQTVLYRHEFADPATQALNVNNRAMLLGLHDIQGYNPIQVQRYVEFMAMLNGHAQDYHDANVFPSGLSSPLLDLLNVRYIVIPAKPRAEQMDFQWLFEHFPTVYSDNDVRVMENPEALPRAWIVHDVRQVAPGEALPLLANGGVNPRTTALVEEQPPALTVPADPSTDQVTILEHQPDRIEARASTSGAGMVVFSEIYDPGWRAFVDGVPVAVHLVDHVLRAISLPAGSHEIELRYQTPALFRGASVTAVTVALLVTAAFVLGMAPRRPRRSGRRLRRSRLTARNLDGPRHDEAVSQLPVFRRF